jgi:hypothetical protein
MLLLEVATRLGEQFLRPLLLSPSKQCLGWHRAKARSTVQPSATHQSGISLGANTFARHRRLRQNNQKCDHASSQNVSLRNWRVNGKLQVNDKRLCHTKCCHDHRLDF